MQNFTIAVKDKETAAQLRDQLQKNGITVHQFNPSSEISFSGKIKLPFLEMEATSTELLEIIQGIGPAVITGLFDTLECFRDRITIFVNGKKTTIQQERLNATFSKFK